MALNTGKILMRRGQEANFDPNKMMPGEWAVSLDSKFVRMCFSPGVCIRMATYEAFEADMEQIKAILAEAKNVESAVIRINNEVSDKLDAVVEYTGQAKAYRDQALQYRNDAERFRNEAQQVAGGNFLTPESAVSFTEATSRSNITTTDTVKIILGKIKKFFTDLKPHAFSNPTNNLLATVAGTPLDAVQGKVLNDKYAVINEKLLVSTNVLGDRSEKTDLLDVSFSKSADDKNKAFRINAADASTLINSPVKSGQFIGKWECIPFSLSGSETGSRLMVKITEFYPLQGRVWFNHYNYNKWAGWFSEYDRLTGYVNKMAEVKTAFGEMGAYENLEVSGSICCQFNVSNKCDIHISCKVISNTVETNLFSFLSGKKIRTLLGINSFSNNAYASKVIVQNYSGTRNLSEFAGLGGLRAYSSASTGDIQIGRIYTEDGQIGGWGVNSELFKAATIFEIDLFNCSYT